jgi:hypothetical protein
MDYTYIDYFNYYLKEYLSELVNTFPETRESILSNYRSLLEGKDDKNDIYAKCYYTKINNFLQKIATKDITLFETPSKIFIEGVDLYDIWNSSTATEDNRTAIWKYLQILMILGRKIIPNHKEIVEILNKVSNGNIIVPAKVEKTLTSDSKDETDETPSVFGLGDIASSLGGLSSLMNGLNKGGEGGGLGGLMNGLSGLMGGGGAGGAGGDSENPLGGLGNLMTGFTDMFSNPEFTNAMSQLSQQFTPSDSAENSGESNCETSEHNDDNCSDDCSENYEEYCNDECKSNDKKQKSTNQKSTSQSSQEQPPQIFNNQLFGDLAEEIGKTFNFEEMEKDGKPKNIGDALSRFMSGNNPAKLMELVGKFGGKLQDEVKKGNINPAELLKQTMSAAGGGQNLQNMMNNPKMQQQMKQMQKQSATPTKDRLRAKLDKKNAEKNE